MKAKKSSAKSIAPGAERLARAEKEMNEAKLSAKEAKLDVKRAKKAAKEARKRFKTARRAYKVLLKDRGGRGKNATAKKAGSSRAGKRPTARREIEVAVALMPHVSRKRIKPSPTPAKPAAVKTPAGPPNQTSQPQVSLTPEDIDVGIFPQNPPVPDVRPPGP